MIIPRPLTQTYSDCHRNKRARRFLSLNNVRLPAITFLAVWRPIIYEITIANKRLRICIRVLVMLGANIAVGCIISRSLTRMLFYVVAIPQYITWSRPPPQCIIRVIYRIPSTSSEAPDTVNSA